MKYRSLESIIRQIHELYGSGTAKMGKEGNSTDNRVAPKFSSLHSDSTSSDGVRVKMAQSETGNKNLKAESGGIKKQKSKIEEAKKRESESGILDTIGDKIESGRKYLETNLKDNPIFKGAQELGHHLPGYENAKAAKEKFSQGDYVGAAGETAKSLGKAAATGVGVAATGGLVGTALRAGGGAALGAAAGSAMGGGNKDNSSEPPKPPQNPSADAPTTTSSARTTNAVRQPSQTSDTGMRNKPVMQGKVQQPKKPLVIRKEDTMITNKSFRDFYNFIAEAKKKKNSEIEINPTLEGPKSPDTVKENRFIDGFLSIQETNGNIFEAAKKMKKESGNLPLMANPVSRTEPKDTKEEVEALDEISKALARRYIKGAKTDIDDLNRATGSLAKFHVMAKTQNSRKQIEDRFEKNMQKIDKRKSGINKAQSRLKEEEEVEALDEKSLAALAPPYDKVTHKDVLVGRGVLKKTSSGKHVLAKKESGPGTRAVGSTTPTRHIDTNGPKNEEVLDEKRGLWDNIHAKRERIKAGSGEKMRKPGSKGAPTSAALKAAQNEEVESLNEISMKVKQSYIDKAGAQASQAASKGFTKKFAEKKGPKAAAARDTFRKRSAGMTKAFLSMKEEEEFLGAFINDGLNEGYDIETLANYILETFELSELSKKTLGSYVKKASSKVGYHANQAAVTNNIANQIYHHKKGAKRLAGVSKAADRLAKEEVELDEAMKIVSGGHEKVHVMHKGKVVKTFKDPRDARMFVSQQGQKKVAKEEYMFSDNELAHIQSILELAKGKPKSNGDKPTSRSMGDTVSDADMSDEEN